MNIASAVAVSFSEPVPRSRSVCLPRTSHFRRHLALLKARLVRIGTGRLGAPASALHLSRSSASPDALTPMAISPHQGAPCQ